MIRKYASMLLAAALCIASLSGCSSVSTSIASGINTVSSALTSPQTVQALNNFAVGVEATICNVASAAAVVQSGAAAAGATVAGIDPKSPLAQTYDIATTVLAVSSTVCTALKGSVGGVAQVTGVSAAGVAAVPVGATK